MKDAEGEEKKRSLEDRLRMSMTSLASTRGEEDKEEEISATEAHALLVSRTCRVIFPFFSSCCRMVSADTI